MAATLRAQWKENQKWREAFGAMEWDDMGDVRGRKECHACGAFEEEGHRESCVFASDPSKALDS